MATQVSSDRVSTAYAPASKRAVLTASGYQPSYIPAAIAAGLACVRVAADSRFVRWADQHHGRAGQCDLGRSLVPDRRAHRRPLDTRALAAPGGCESGNVDWRDGIHGVESVGGE